MTDDLKERLDHYRLAWGELPSISPHNETSPGLTTGRVITDTQDALALITDLEARLAAAEAKVTVWTERTGRWVKRAEDAMAGEDALAKALRITRERLMDAVHSEFDGVWSAEDFNEQEAEAVAALAAYEARREK